MWPAVHAHALGRAGAGRTLASAVLRREGEERRGEPASATDGGSGPAAAWVREGLDADGRMG
jgi:hypothetical protein